MAGPGFGSGGGETSVSQCFSVGSFRLNLHIQMQKSFFFFLINMF